MDVQGQLGDGSYTNRYEPHPVNGLTGVTTIGCGYNNTYPYSYTMAITTDGTRYGWGYNGNGELENGTADTTNIPVEVDLPW